MRTEAAVFAVVSGFFLVVGVLYGVWSQDPAGIAALTVALLMSLLITFFFAVNYVRRGPRPEDRKKSDVSERAGSVDFFPPSSPWPVTTAAGAAVLALGVVYAVWLFLIGLGLVMAGVCAMAFQYAGREG
ncbi:cytochrome c oxidase subunit 4 [Streptomyces sp. HNM0663]|uniref:cytochrome-c oxidase n=1 Tax=Streptomyces chengmaiensis TaxID=3040919 RepID=A0ABT6HV26_9ACTN|nr:cytochrome c oxidase subunit 4 [Streptomyces chengmaiensis]MDH2392561.1 cytochrome c oxidase subunit 4 [Streptomyces chengmaiensis]